MMIPRWVPFLVAVWVIAFGLLRLRIALRKDDDDAKKPSFRKGGYYARSKRSHLLFGIAYLILGAYCVAMGFGYHVNLLGSCMGRTSREQAAPATEGAVPVELPAAKKSDGPPATP